MKVKALDLWEVRGARQALQHAVEEAEVLAAVAQPRRQRLRPLEAKGPHQLVLQG